MAGPYDISRYDALKVELAQQTATLRAGAPASGDGGTWTTEQVGARLGVLSADFDDVVAHSKFKTITGAQDFACAACGRGRPCPAIEELSARYSAEFNYDGPSVGSELSDDLEVLVAEQ